MAGDLFMNAGMDRRRFIGVGVGALVVASMPWALRKPTAVVRRSVPVMGTIADVTVVHPDERVAQDAIDAAVRELLRVERTMTRFTAVSDIGRANASAARDGVRISDETAGVIASSLEWAVASDGRFDPAIGSVVELWDVANRHEPPAPDRVRPLASRGFWRKVDVSRINGASYVRFTDRDVRLDLGGIAKGYGVDRAVAVLRERGVRHAIVNVGGDLYALGNAPGGDAWSVGIRSPHDADAIVTTLAVSNAAVCTSGGYEQFFDWKGKQYHHLMDPETAAPRDVVLRSMTVRANRCIDADAAATAAFGLGRVEAVRIAGRISRNIEMTPLV
jgi:thiamine biosynthesis lipoprotein